MENSIFLIGFRAVGKSTVGVELANRLSCDFLDTDRIICQRKDASIEAIVREEGWAGFRQLEKEVLADLAGCRNCVVATGGGAILHREIWRRLRLNSLVVWLTASLAVLTARLRQDEGSGANRPSLTGRDAISEMRAVLIQREPLYRETAHLAIASDMFDIQQIADKIQQACGRKRGGRRGNGR